MVRPCLSLSCLVLLALGGCLHRPAIHEQIDTTLCDLAAQTTDPQPSSHEPRQPTPAKKEDKETKPRAGLHVPDELMPGGTVPPIELPSGEEENEAARKKALEQLYPELPPLSDDGPAPPGLLGKPLTLADLQKLARSNSPRIKQAFARVEEARGQAVQAGLPPNPTVGYESDTSGTTGGPGYVGGFIEQTIKTGNKLQLARAAAAIELRNAEIALAREMADLMTEVRRGYFAVLAAQEAVRLNRALVTFTSEVYQLQVDQVKRGGFAAPYEPMYLRAQATQALASLVQARNRRTAAWKALASTLGLPGLCPTQLCGRLDVAVPDYCYKDVLAKVLACHTEVQTGRNALALAQVQLEIARMTPIPDVNLRVMVQKDRTAPPFLTSPSVMLSVPVPVWDRNQGGIQQAEAAVIRAGEEGHRVRAELTRNVAEAFERYQNARVVLGYYRDRILPDLVRVYRGVYKRYQEEPGGGAATPPGFTDVVVAQQNLAQAMGSYLTNLGQLWQGVVDVADYLQTPDLFGVNAPTHPVAAIPDLEKLPCCHRCSPLPEAHQKTPDGSWPKAD